MGPAIAGITTIGDRPDHWADAARVLGPSVNLLQESVELQRMSAGGYDDAQERVGATAQHLVARGAAGVMVGGTSFTFYRGHPFHDELLRRVRKVTGVPVSSTSQAMLDGLRAVGARRLAVATAYTADVDERLRRFLEEAGYDIVALRGMGMDDPSQVERVTPEATADLAREVYAAAPESDCLVISCGGLRTLDIIVPLEEACGLPVVTSYTATVWGLTRLAGVPPRARLRPPARRRVKPPRADAHHARGARRPTRGCLGKPRRR